MSHNSSILDGLRLYSFDTMNLGDATAIDRWYYVKEKTSHDSIREYVKLTPHGQYNFEGQLEDTLEKKLDFLTSAGYEGLMLKALSKPYKHGRASKSKMELVKLKRFFDDEAVIVGVEEELSIDGTKKGTLGSLTVKYKDVQFSIGTGFDDASRDLLWSLKDYLIGEEVTFKYQELSHNKVPRFPVFKSIRKK